MKTLIVYNRKYYIQTELYNNPKINKKIIYKED